MSLKRKNKVDIVDKPAKKPVKSKVSDFGAALAALVEAPVTVPAPKPAVEEKPTTAKLTKASLKSKKEISAPSKTFIAAREKMSEKRRANSTRVLTKAELEAKAESKAAAAAKNKTKARRLMLERYHVDAQHTELEKKLIRVATKGVVTLFNAVNEQQKKIEEIERSVALRADEKDKLTKKEAERGFLELLKESTQRAATGAAARPVDSDSDSGSDSEAVTGSAAPKSSWNVFDEEYMLGKEKMKNWDKSSDSESGSDSD